MPEHLWVFVPQFTFLFSVHNCIGSCSSVVFPCANVLQVVVAVFSYVRLIPSGVMVLKQIIAIKESQYWIFWIFLQ